MAISDIGRTMAMYTQPSQFDQTAWKAAFDIANGFNKLEDSNTQRINNKRLMREGLNTEYWRTNANNADFRNKTNLADWSVRERDATMENKITNTNWSNIAGTEQLINNYDNYKAQSQWQDFYRNITEQLGRNPTPEELQGYAMNNGALNNAAFMNIANAGQQFLVNEANRMALVNPYEATQLRGASGTTNYGFDKEGNYIDLNSPDRIIARADQITPETRNAILGIGNNNGKWTEQQKLDYQSQIKFAELANKDLSELQNIDGMVTVNENGTATYNKQVFDQSMANLYARYQGNPMAMERINNFANTVARNQGWVTPNAQTQTAQDGNTQATATGEPQVSIAPVAQTTQQAPTAQVQPQAQPQAQVQQITPEQQLAQQKTAFANQYQATADEMALISNWAQEAGISEQQALKEASSLFNLRTMGQASNKDILEGLQYRIQSAQRQKQREKEIANAKVLADQNRQRVNQQLFAKGYDISGY